MKAIQTKNPKRKSFSKKKRLEILSRTAGRCGYCGVKLEKFHIDHIQPIHSNAGTNDDENLIASCIQCNSFKGGNPLRVFRKELECQLERVNRYSVNYRMAKKFGMISEYPRSVKFFFEKSECRWCGGKGETMPTQGDYITPDRCLCCGGTGRS